MKNTAYRLTSIFLTILMLSLSLTSCYFLTGGQDKESESEKSTLTTADESTKEPDIKDFIPISSKAELDAVRNDLAGYYYLTQDIEFDESDFAEGGSFYNDAQGWQPIGNAADNAFTGIFDGKGFAIKGLSINITEAGSDLYIGLFGYNKGSIKNLTLEDSSISVKILLPTLRDVCTGGIVGFNESGEILNCRNNADVYSVLSAGGVAGVNHSIITDSHNAGTITSDFCAGGIVGISENDSKISDCENTGEISALHITGGISGENFDNSIVSNCKNSAGIFSYSDYSIGSSYICIGGISGQSGENCIIENSCNTGTVYTPYRHSKCAIGGIAGISYSRITDCRNEGEISFKNGMVSSVSILGGITGQNYNTITDSHNIGKITALTSPNVVAFVSGISGINNFGSSIVNCYNTGEILTDIKNSHNDSKTCAGGIVASNKGEILNSYNTGKVSAFSDGIGFPYMLMEAGGIVGEMNYGTIKDSYNTGDISVVFNIPGPIGGDSFHAASGGIAGRLRSSAAKVENCYNTGKICSESINLESTSGGIVGVSLGDITNCYNAGAVCSNSKSSSSGGIVGSNDSNIKFCYNIGDIASSKFSGGLIGTNKENGVITDCYFLNNIGDSVGVGDSGGVSCSNEKMQLKDTFAGFDFADIWVIDTESEYKLPQFKDAK